MANSDLELGPVRFSILGAGRLGRVLGRALLGRGLQLSSACTATPESAAQASHALGVPTFTEPSECLRDADVVLICVPDREIAPLARYLAPSLAHSDLRFVHTSGCISLDALDPLRTRGCDVLSMHPLQTVTHFSAPADLEGAAAAITAHDPAGRTFGHALAHAVGLHPFDLDEGARSLYHAASSLAANGTVALLSAVRDLAQAAGLEERMALNMFCRLAHAAVDRTEREGPEAALTGPIVRGDRETIALHLAALEATLPQHTRLYRELGQNQVALATASGRLGVEQAAQLATVLAGSQA